MAPEYKLTYFAMKGMAEPIRFLLKYGGIEFEDDRFELEQWADISKNMPFGQVPLLTVNGRQYNQNVAIARFVAKEVNLVGNDDLEDLEIDAIIDTIQDLRLKIAQNHYDPDESVKAARKDILIKETIPYYLQRLDKIVKENNGHLACKKLTWADIYFVPLMVLINDYIGTDVFSKYENLKMLENSVLSIPSIKKWVEERPQTQY